MKKLLTFLIIIIPVVILITGCPRHGVKYKYQAAWFPDKPVDIVEVNSEFDDYNSILPETHFGKRLLFSSNRKTDAANYDIYDGNFYVVWDWETGNLTFHKDYHYGYDDNVGKLVSRTETEGNQFAPYYVPSDTTIANKQYKTCYFLYSSNADSNIYYSRMMYYISPDDFTSGEITGPVNIPFLGDEKQQYVSFYGPDIVINNYYIPVDNFTEMYFDKTDDGISNIYKINIPDSLNFIRFLTSDYNYPKVKVDAVNSQYNDRCPFVNGNFMVFASDRPGGYGGYDLYYSIYENGEWQEPVNFGDKINTEYDEFRPLPVHVMDFNNDLMIFSSNRPGGLGGFDLYYVGIDNFSDKYQIE